MALGLTQPLKEISTRNISWGVKAAGDNLTTFIVLKCGSLNLVEPSGPVQACNGTALPYCPDLRLLEDRTDRLYRNVGS